MSIAIPFSSTHGLIDYGQTASSRAGGHALTQTPNAFDLYAAPKAAAHDTGSVIRQSANQIPPPHARHAMWSIPSPETARLHDSARLLKRTETELNTLTYQLRNDPSLGLKPGQVVRTKEAVLDFIVAKAKQSGLYGALQQEAVQRLKNSGNFENIVNKLLEMEQAQGRTRDRAWAENWIERSYDYDCVDQDYVEGAPFFFPGCASDDVDLAHENKGTAVFYGDKSNIQARGSFFITITENDNGLLFYTVSDGNRRDISEPKPYDPRGTVIKADGLRAEMIGSPAPGDMFSIFKGDPNESPQHHFTTLDALDIELVAPRSQKKRVFDSVFGPIISKAFMGDDIVKRPSDSVVDKSRLDA